MQFQVPQFIETEDKIVGPLSLRQFLYLVGAAGLSVILFFTVQLWLWAIISIPIAALGIGIAFIKINGQPLPKLLISALSYFWRPTTYVWQPHQPKLPKTQSTLQPFLGASFSLESIFSGLALRHAREKVQTGTKVSEEKSKRILARAKEKYEVVQRISGELRAARRVDYR